MSRTTKFIRGSHKIDVNIVSIAFDGHAGFKDEVL